MTADSHAKDLNGALTHAGALAMAYKIIDGSLDPIDFFREKSNLLQPLLVDWCSPPEFHEPSELTKIRLDALTAIANKGLSVNGSPGTTSPLHMACASRSVDLASALLTFGGNPKSRDENNRTPSQRIPDGSPEKADLMRMLRAAELRMMAMQAIERLDLESDLHTNGRDVMVARAFRGSVKKMGL